MTDTTPTPPAASTPAPAVGPKTNVLAIVSLVTGILGLSIVAIITGHIGLSQIKKRGEGGNVLAIVGLVLGYLGSLIWIGIWISVIATGAFLSTYGTFSY